MSDRDAALDEIIERAYWEFDARRSGYGQWKGIPQSERDAFKQVVRNLLLSTTIRTVTAP